jgi:two-component system response regulator AtoC
LAPTVIVIDDEALIRKSLSKVLRAKGFKVETAETCSQGLSAVEETDPQIVIIDLRLPDGNGLDLIPKIHQMDPSIRCIVITGHGDVQSAVEAMKLGASDFLKKPYDMEEIVLAVESASTDFRMTRELDSYKRKEMEVFGGRKMVGNSQAMEDIRRLIEKVAGSDATTVLVQGESGTGKELVARAIHHTSERAKFPFMEVNCSSFQETLLENELFGHEKGAFTDALELKKGLVELSDMGTLFLDEVGDMPLSTQAKLLRFIDNKSFKRVGGSRDITVDIRIIAATNKDVEKAVEAGSFRPELYYRLKVVSIHVPPLRERPEDIATLAEFFMDEFNRKFRKKFRGMSPEAKDILLNYQWPGNVRELRNILERAVLLEDSGLLEKKHLPKEMISSVEEAPKPKRPPGLPQDSDLVTLDELESDYIKRVVEAEGGNKTRAARTLGISRQSLIDRLKRMSPKEKVIR